LMKPPSLPSTLRSLGITTSVLSSLNRVSAQMASVYPANTRSRTTATSFKNLALLMDCALPLQSPNISRLSSSRGGDPAGTKHCLKCSR
jgi:hypothetical protein